ncbi:MAG: hypothetical protein ACRD2L_24380 [Terriglobia bacterium]
MSFLDQLQAQVQRSLAEKKLSKRERKRAGIAPPEIKLPEYDKRATLWLPIRLIMYVRVIRCGYCSHEQRSSGRIHFEYVSTHKATTRWISRERLGHPSALLAALPRETVLLEGTVPQCEHCFDAEDFRQGELPLNGTTYNPGAMQ